jgi:hypothetical protein
MQYYKNIGHRNKNIYKLFEIVLSLFKLTDKDTLCLGLRNGTTDEEEFFGFKDNFLDEDAAEAWLNGAIGYVTIIFNQGTYIGNWIQSNTLYQPRLVIKDPVHGTFIQRSQTNSALLDSEVNFFKYNFSPSNRINNYQFTVHHISQSIYAQCISQFGFGSGYFESGISSNTLNHTNFFKNNAGVVTPLLTNKKYLNTTSVNFVTPVSTTYLCKGKSWINGSYNGETQSTSASGVQSTSRILLLGRNSTATNFLGRFFEYLGTNQQVNRELIEADIIIRQNISI